MALCLFGNVYRIHMANLLQSLTIMITKKEIRLQLSRQEGCRARVHTSTLTPRAVLLRPRVCGEQ